MKNKKIIFSEPCKVELLEEELREELNNTEVLVRICYSTISSGTERSNLMGEKNVSVHNTEVPFPRCSGYSSSGIVEKVGDGVKNIAVGDRVAVSWSVHSRYLIVDNVNVHKIEFDDVSLSEAALVHISTFPMLAIRKCGLEFGESAMVVGLGVLGLIGVILLKAAGAYPIVAVDLVEEKRDLALALGADYAFDPREAGFADNVKAVSKGINVAIEVTGSGPALNSTLDCMAPYGRIALLGCTRNSDFTVDYYHKVHGPGINLIGANTWSRPWSESSPGRWTTHDDAMAILGMLHGKRINFAQLVEEIHSPDEATKVYDRLISNSNFPVVQFDWERMI